MGVKVKYVAEPGWRAIQSWNEKQWDTDSLTIQNIKSASVTRICISSDCPFGIET